MTTSQTIPNLTPEQAAEQARILREGSASDAHQFACHHPGADIPALQARLLSVCGQQEAYLLAYFAKEVGGADVSSLQARILEIGSDADAFVFARDVLGADISALQSLVLSVGVERRLNGVDNDGMVAFLFAKDIRGADIAALQQHVMAVGSGWYALEFALAVAGADVQACQARVLEVGGSQVLFEFARDVPGADVPALYERAVQRGFNSCGDDSMEIEFGFKTLVSYYQNQRKWTETDADSDEAAPTELAPSPA